MRTQPNHYPKSMTDRFPVLQGLWILPWKDWLQSWRRSSYPSVIAWLAIFVSSLGLMLVNNRVTLFWVFIIWGLLISQVCLQRLNSDLRLWVLFRQLPFSAKQLILAEVANSVTGATLLVWLAYGICSLSRWNTNLIAAVLAPGTILCLTLTAVFDLLRKSNSNALLAGHPVHTGAIGIYLGLVLAGLPLALVIWQSGLTHTGTTPWLYSLLGLLLSLGIDFVMWHLAAAQLIKIK